MRHEVNTTYRVTADIDSQRSPVIYAVYLHGPEGVVQFKFAVVPGTVASEVPDLWTRLEDGTTLMGWDIGHHSPKPLYGAGDWPLDGQCDLLGGVPCYYDGSTLNAERILKGWIQAGTDEYLIGEMMDWYEHHLGARPTDVALPGRPVLALTVGGVR